jgi:PAS domain S-box-containing protein
MLELIPSGAAMTKSENEQLRLENQELREQLNVLQQANEKLQGSEQMYRALFEHSGFSITIIDPQTKKIVAFNTKEHETLGYTKEEFLNLPVSEIVVESANRNANIQLVNEKGSHLAESFHKTKTGGLKTMLISSVAVNIQGQLFHQNIAVDITHLKNVEKALKEAHDELEDRVEERTAELHQKTNELLESNIALKVVMQKQNESMKDVEEKLLLNTKQLILPSIEKLKKENPTEKQLVNILELEIKLKDILSPFLQSLTKQYHSLTPSEIKIASLIREGKTSKELAEIFGVSLKTVEAHRANLRKKLELNNKKINLQAHLRSLENTNFS